MPHVLQKSKNHFSKIIFKFIAEVITPTYHSYRRWKFKNIFLRFSGLSIGRKVIIDNNFYTLIGYEKNINIGDYTIINSFCKIMSYGRVQIGKFCLIAAEVSITNGGHNKYSYKAYSSDIIIGNGVWIGHRATIVAKENGLRIGNNVIIGAGSLVINDIPDNAIVAGCPAKVIDFRRIETPILHKKGICYDPFTYSLIEPNVNINESLKEFIYSHSIIDNQHIEGEGGVEILSACVLDKNGQSTLNVKINDELRFYIHARASKIVKEPYFSISIMNKNKENELVFVGTTVQINDYSKILHPGNEIVIGFKLKMSVESGEYLFRLSCAEPLIEQHPNKGISLIAHNFLGPIVVNFDYELERAPFYGIAQLHMEVVYEH